VLKTGDAGSVVDAVCPSGLQWTGDEGLLLRDDTTTVSRLSDAAAFDAGSMTASVYKIQQKDTRPTTSFL